jgi:hypothetical protein
MSITGNIRGQRTQSSTNGYKTLGSSIASGIGAGTFKRIYINAYQRYNGNSELALSSTLGIQKGDYKNNSSQAFTTVSSSSGPKLNNLRYKVRTDSTASSLTEVSQSAIKCIGNIASITPEGGS